MQGAENTLEHRMLTDTLGAFGDGNTTMLTPERGILLIEGWLNPLRGDVGAERIVAELEMLRDLLKSGDLDGDKIRLLLLNMASHTSAISHEPVVEEADARQLRQLATALRNFASQF
ncbi:hypothetical protein HNV11_19730 [Spirosoma taeanense]|uniref:Uncharacterized protein n=1 Tax=Spirosoma taeanense TaxID=2735870 RepID=A0A6M5YBV6_9BACT|nr:hypothetical protein [Spirosoma taeanense]QJW91449.1 hypothetical protein HNV11_19730 [Spirosoma taeanense]